MKPANKKGIILAGGLGTRLEPFTRVIPKPLLPIGEKAVLEIQIERMQKHGFNEIFLATNYKSDYIKNFFGDGSMYNVELTINTEQIPLGTAGPVKLLEDKLTEPFLVMNGDILSLINFSRFYSFAVEKGSILTVAIKKEVLPFAFGNIFFEGDYVTEVQEKPKFTTNILAGIYIMTPEIFNYIPKDKYFGMDTLIQNLINENIPVAKYEMDEYWLDIGQLTDYDNAQEIYKKHFLEGTK